MDKNRYDKIGPTAWGVAHHRSLSDIKFAKEIFKELDSVIKPTEKAQIEYLELSKSSKRSPQFEARYKLIDRLLAKSKINQVLELASGLAPRGLAMSLDNPASIYIEFDLPEMIEYKKEILKKLSAAENIKLPSNLYLESGDVLNLGSLELATKHFKKEPIAIVHEGLLRYLDFKQKEIVARYIHSLLKKFGGAWITSDVTLKRLAAFQEEREKNQKAVLAISGIDVKKNAFDNEGEARKFFEELGFSVESHPFLEVQDQLVSPLKVGLSSVEVRKMISDLVVFVMRVK